MHIVEREQKIARAERELTPKLGRPPTDEEIAEAAKLPIKQVREVRDAARAVTSLDKPIGDDNEAAFGDLVAGDDGAVRGGGARLARAGDAAPGRRRAARARARGAAAPLRPERRQRAACRSRRSGARLGITRERVRQIEAEALERLAVQREIEALRAA